MHRREHAREAPCESILTPLGAFAGAAIELESDSGFDEL